MKNKCLDDFYKNLENKTNGDYVNSLKELIDQKDLTADSFSKLIEKEVEK